MKNPKQDSTDADATHERTLGENEKLRRNKKEREKEIKIKNCLPEQNAAGLNEKDGEDEEEDLYRKEENRGSEEAA
jgi:hypothetical protein